MRISRFFVVTALLVLIFALPQASRGDAPTATASLGHAQQRDSVDLLLGLIREQGALTRHVQQISDPDSPRYREYLPISKIQRRYGANPQARTAVRSYVNKNGGRVRFDAVGGSASVRMSARTAARLFGARVDRYRSRDAGAFTALASEPKVPDALRPYVSEVVSGNTTTKIRPQAKPPPASSKQINIPSRTGTPAGCPEGLATQGFSPSQIATAHDFKRLHERNVKGQRRIVALLEFGGGVNASDMATFAGCFRVEPPRLVQIPVGINQPFNASSPAGIEASLDVQVLMGMAPGLKRISMYEGSADSDFYPVMAAALDSRVGGNQLPDAISVSYGVCEPALVGGVNNAQAIRLDRYVLLVAAAAGVTVSFSAGDTGSSGCVEGLPTVTAPYTEYAASEPFTTAVGGTSFTLRPDNQINLQTTWNDTAYGVPPAEAGGGGGGSSFLFSRPSYQRKPAGEKGRGARKVPDISFYADEAPGWIIYCTATTGECAKHNGYLRVGGTSAASPTFAAMVALSNQYAAQRNVPRLGFANPLLYQYGYDKSNVFYDVTQGTNDLFGVGCCSAARGYDPATGWGSVRAHRFAIDAARAWQSSPTGKR